MNVVWKAEIGFMLSLLHFVLVYNHTESSLKCYTDVFKYFWNVFHPVRTVNFKFCQRSLF